MFTHANTLCPGDLVTVSRPGEKLSSPQTGKITRYDSTTELFSVQLESETVLAPLKNLQKK